MEAVPRIGKAQRHHLMGLDIANENQRIFSGRILLIHNPDINQSFCDVHNFMRIYMHMRRTLEGIGINCTFVPGGANRIGHLSSSFDILI